jgi:hypothetical protein
MENLIENLLKEATEREVEHQQKLNHISDNQLLITETPWLRRTGWRRRFTDKDMEELNKLTEKPTGGILMEVWQSAGRTIQKCFDGVLDCHNRGWTLIPFWLASSDTSKPDTIPFRMYFAQETIDRYTTYWQRFIIFCLRSFENQENGVEFTREQKNKIEELQRVLRSEIIITDSVDKKVLELSLLFIKHSDYLPQRSALIYFSGILGWNLSWKQWRRPEDYTPILAGIQFCMRVLILESAVPIDERKDWFDNYEQNPLQIFRQTRDRWLTEGEASPFNYIHKLLNFGMEAAKNSTTWSRVRWSTDNKTLYFDGRALKMEDWKRFLN